MKNSNEYLRYNTRPQIHVVTVIASGYFIFLDP